MHNIDYRSFPENVDKKKVKAEIDDYVAHEDWQEGASGLSSPIRWYETTPPCADYDDAKAFIDAHDNGWYDNLAVRYFKHNPVSGNKKKELEDKVNLAREKSNRLSSALYPQTLKSEFIGCKDCGSKLARRLLKTNFCPVCRADLRPETTLSAIRAADEKLKKAQDALCTYVKAHRTVNKIMWLVKYEYHT